MQCSPIRLPPHIGGVARSVDGLSRGLRDAGHDVLVVAPEFPNARKSTPEVIRMLALQDFTGSDFALSSPFSWALHKRLDSFAPDIIHSHHPFLLGGTALRVATMRNLPVVYTSHTRYDLYGHYIIQNSDIMKRLALNLTSGYCDLCDHVIAPSNSTAIFLHDQNVVSPICVIPTGINTVPLANVDIPDERRNLGIPADAFLVGHVGRLAVEKNLPYLAQSITLFLEANKTAHALVVGEGAMAEVFKDTSVSERVHMTGALTGEALTKAYSVMDVFAFSSKSETQGLVLIEAMVTGVPVIALDAPGARDVITDGQNGYLLPGGASVQDFTDALCTFAKLGGSEIQKLRASAISTSGDYTQDATVQKTADLYKLIISRHSNLNTRETSSWEDTRKSLTDQWNILGNLANAVSQAIFPSRKKIE